MICSKGFEVFVVGNILCVVELASQRVQVGLEDWVFCVGRPGWVCVWARGDCYIDCNNVDWVGWWGAWECCLVDVEGDVCWAFAGEFGDQVGWFSGDGVF